MVLIRPDRGYTMAELVEKTGLTDRQIRRCIAEELVGGAEGKGPGARYSEKTLRGLQLIRRLQEQKVEPLGRQLTLKEIKSTLDSLNRDQEDQILSGMAFSFIDTDGQAAGEPDRSAVEAKLNREFLDIHEKALRRDDIGHASDDFEPSVVPDYHSRRPRGTTFYHGDLGEFGTLLQMLSDKLDALVHEKRDPDPSEEDTWVRVRTRSPIIEIHLKAPRNANDRARLIAVKTAVEDLIRRGYGPY